MAGVGAAALPLRLQLGRLLRMVRTLLRHALLGWIFRFLHLASLAVSGLGFLDLDPCRAQVLYHATLALLEGGHEAVYTAVERPLQFAQTAAIMEILHGLVGLVRSPVSATLPQIGSRLFLTWGILWSFPETHTHILVTSLVISWSITEIIRYSFFGMKEALGFAPSWLLWLRYSTFMILYPTGIFSEVGLLIFIALPYMKASGKYCLRMPNKWNFSLDYSYTSALSIAVYVPGGPHMFTYMLAQRKKALSKAKTAKCC